MQAWAFEMREGGGFGLVGTWTPGACEVQRLAAIEAKLNASIGECHVVMLIDEPAGIAVWAIMLPDVGFIAASSPEICEEDRVPGPGIWPVSFVSPRCQRAWLLVPSQGVFDRFRQAPKVRRLSQKQRAYKL